MKFMKATIYGFGKWVDYTIDFSPDSFVCIFGENESGKTTLQRFILFMLFGLPPKQRTYYQPKTSSKMGGRLTIFDPDIGEYTIERLDGTRNGAAVCYTEDGLEHDEQWLEKRLIGMTESIYRSVYSFNAADLSDIQQMNQEEIGEVLLGIGLTGSTQIHTVEKRLDAQIGELFKPFGTRPKINEHLKKMDELAKETQKYKQAEHTYHEKKQRMLELASEKERLETSLTAKKEEKIILEKKLQALPYIHDLIHNKNRLRQLSQDRNFPSHGIDRLKALKEHILPLHSEQSVLKAEASKHEEEKAVLEKEINKDLQTAEAEKILKQKQTYINRQHDLNKLKETMNQIEAEINRELNHLNIGLSQAQIQTLQLPFHTEQTWNELKGEQDQLKLEEEQLNEEEQMIKGKQAHLKDELNDRKAQRLSIQERQKLASKLKAFQESELMNKLEEDMDRTKTSLEKKRVEMRRQNKVVLGGSIVLAFIFIVIFAFTEASIFINLGMFSLLAGIIYWGLQHFIFKKIQTSLHIENINTASPTYSEQEIEEAQYLIAQDDDLQQDEKFFTDQLKDLDIQFLQLYEKKESWTYKKDRLQERIGEQHHFYPFLKEVAVAFWPELYHQLKNILRLKHNLNQVTRETAELEKQQTQFANRVSAITKKSGIGEQVIDLQLQRLEQMNNDMKDKRTRILQINQLLNENLERRQELHQQIATYQQEVTQLFDLAHVTDEEAFYKKSNDIEEAWQLERLIEKNKEQFAKVFVPHELDELIENTPKESALEISMLEIEENIKNIEARIEEIRQETAELTAILMTMESSDQSSNAMHRLDMKKSALNDMARQWAVLRTAKGLLADTKRRYRDKYLTRVIHQTTVYFKELTDYRYERLFIPEEEKQLLVETADHTRYAVNELSQGTINQLYISLRLAISEVMNEKQSLPFIIDDAFVHFDAKRTERILEILQKQSENHQIILFTCKPSILDYFGKNRSVKLEKITSKV